MVRANGATQTPAVSKPLGRKMQKRAIGVQCCEATIGMALFRALEWLDKELSMEEDAQDPRLFASCRNAARRSDP